MPLQQVLEIMVGLIGYNIKFTHQIVPRFTRHLIGYQYVDLRDEAHQTLVDMLEWMLVSLSKSPWSSPVIQVQMRDGSVHFCADYRTVNALTTKDAYPFPHIDEILDTLSGVKWFSTLDLISGTGR